MMRLKLLSVFVILVSILLSSHGLLEFLGSCAKGNDVTDHATVEFVSSLEHRVTLLTRSQQCWKCSLVKEGIIERLSNKTLNFSTDFAVEFFIEKHKHDQNSYFCNITIELQSGNEYVFNVNEDSCTVKAMCSDLPNPNIPAYCLAGFVIALCVVWEICLALKRNGIISSFKSRILKESAMFFARNSEEDSSGGSQESTTDLVQADLGGLGEVQKDRVHSLDAFRGFSLVLMIFVNYGGGGYWFFHHAAWDGLTLGDLVFPWFVFIMGTTASITFQSIRRRKVGRLETLRGVLRRSAVLFFLGLVLSNQGRSLSNLRIPGVLQRLSLTFLVVGIVETLENPSTKLVSSKFWSFLRDVLPYWKSWIVVVLFVIAHTCTTFLMTVPGCPKGYLGPGGLHDDGMFENCTGGAAGHLDRLILGSNHIYQHPTCKGIYKTKVPFDPEGILATLTSVVTCYFGVQAGRILLSYGPSGRLARWLLWGVALGLLGGTLCGFKQFGGLVPLNKNLWSISFTCVLSSLAFLVFMVFYLLIDHLGVWSGAPFIYPGMNSILVYLCSEIFEHFFPLHLSNPTTHLGLTLQHAWGALFWILVSAVLHSKKMFFSV